MQRLYFGLVPKEVDSQTVLDFFKKYDPELYGFSFNTKLLSYNFGFFDTTQAERILKQNGLKSMGFYLRLRPVKRPAFVYCEYDRELCYNDKLVYQQLAREAAYRQLMLEREQNARKAFHRAPRYGGACDVSEDSDSMPFDAIAPRPSVKEFCGVKKSRRPLIPVRKEVQ